MPINLVELAQRIRKLRIDRRMTLEDVCAAAGLTRSWLSKVENFRVTPSLPALAKIADTLGVHLSELLEGLDSKPQIVVVRKDERQKVLRDEQISNITYESLAYKRTGRRMDPFLLHLPPGATRVEPLAHEGEEFLLVIKGSTDFEYGDGNYELHEGDSLYFDASVPHRLVNRSESIVQVLCVFGELNNL